ncbi:MAG: translation initiation factor IF-3 [Solobacterium sp.]|nr:translation initiation factor IF-3 [Solobacterium sp.]MDY2953553.1 translation initiation factor IF-3 [Erysipelotrichaceae bacterium]MCI7157074.1 translation initiation factor IF-3 [Solobacterium sp.]MCI7444952.1 translation initiation factor IF-3 [Solobacterium sp.]MDD5801564.1 translation initiation factor IF-3 [Solobacterium sp.]
MNIAGKKPEDLVNENIRFREVLVIDSDGSQLGKMSRNEALNKAYDQELDLLCVSANSNPPVCKILDYGRYKFEAQKKAKEAKKNQHVTELKPLRLSPVIDKHDFDTKIKQATGWLDDGMKVKVDMRFRGRMMTRQEVGLKVMNDFISSLSDLANVDKQPKLEGNVMSCVLMPKKK